MSADALTTLASVKAWLGLPSSYTASDTILNLLISEVSAAITESCNRQYFLVTNALCPQTRFLSGTGDQWLVYPEWPIRQVQATGTLTADSTSVTALSFTSPWAIGNLFAGQTVFGDGIAQGTTLTAASGSTATLSDAATESGSGVALTFGLGIWEDETGYYGQGNEVFGDGDLLAQGIDYVLKADQIDGRTSKSGMILRLNQNWPQQYGTQPGGLAVYGTGGHGNLKVVANVGYDSVPPDLEMAALRVIARVRATRRFGQIASSASFEGASVSFAPEIMPALGVLGGDVAQVLARYRVDALSVA